MTTSYKLQVSASKMISKLTILVLVAVSVNSESKEECKDSIRIKRSKYYSSPPPRFYRRPPFSYPSRNAFSYTPPPSYMLDEDEPTPIPSNPRPKFRKPDGLEDDDINNILKYLSKRDLDKIIEFASEKSSKHKEPYEKYKSKDDEEDFQVTVQDSDTNERYPEPNKLFDSPNRYLEESSQPKAVYVTNPNKHTPYSQTAEQNESKQFAFIDAYIQKDIKGDTNVHTENKMMKEEVLPLPVNLRDVYEVSNTNNVHTVVNSASSSYDVENFGDLPLMNFYNSKLNSVSSYHVPHYTVTTSPELTPPPIQPFQGASLEAARAQSDAHLKAIKVWTHKSRGTAYTLHDDGSLSLERPLRPKFRYGHP